jgi:hypothetical protein
MSAVIGVDIGQRREPTAICVIEREERRIDSRTEEAHFLVRYLQRLPLGTPYPEVSQRVGEIVAGVREKSAGRLPEIYADVTGLGQSIIDVLEARIPGSQVIAVYFNHGDRRVEEMTGEVKLGKAWLVTRLQVLLQAGRLHLPKTNDAEVLAQELLDYEIHVQEDANERYGAFRVGSQDDLLTALGLAVQRDWKPALAW